MHIRSLYTLSLNQAKRQNPVGRESLEALERRENPSGLVGSFHLDSDWGSGMQGTVTIENQTNAPVSNWKLTMDYGNPINSIWDANIASKTSSGYQITHNGWNSSIAPGQKVSFGFVGGATNGTGPKNFVITADGLSPTPTPAPAPAPTPTPTPVGQVQVKVGYKVTSDWGTGFNGEITITNIGTAGISGWQLGFNSSNNLTSIWNANKIQGGPNYLVSDVGWNKDIGVGSSVSFGFTAEGNSKAVPPGFTFNGQSVGSTPTPAPTPAPTPTNRAPVAVNDSGWVSAGASTKINLLGNDSDPDKDVLKVKSVTAGALGTTALQADGTVVYTPGVNFKTTDTFNYTITDPAGLTSTASVTVNLLSEGTKVWPSQVFAPYVDTTLWPTFDMVKVAKEQGLRHFSLAFITATSVNKAAWGGFNTYEIDGQDFDLKMRAQIGEIRALGGDVDVSFGGANGRELAEAITDRAALKAAYRQVIDTYGIKRVDFDIEGGAVDNKALNDYRSGVLAELQADLQKEGRPLEIWLTLPVLPTGLTPDGVYVVQSAIKAGVKLGGVNIMTMDYGEWAAPNPNGKMGDYAIQAATSLQGQLKSLYAGYSDAKLWSMVGITPMIGRNDVTTEVFDQQEAKEVLAFAQQKGIGELSFWSLNRDQQNPKGLIPGVENNSSSIVQTPYEFSNLFKVFTSSGTSSGTSPGSSTGGTGTTPPAVIPNLSVASVSMSEGNSGTSNLDFKVQLSAASASAVSFTVNTSNATATAGSDYTALSGKVFTIAAGNTEAIVSVAVTGDTVVESNETFTLVVSAATGATIINGQATGTITNDDTASPPTPGGGAPKGKRVVSYFAEWGIYGRNYTIADLPVDKLTTINYAFAKITDAGEVGIFDSWAAVEKPFGTDTWNTPLRGNYHQLQLLKQSHPNLEILISVGGWTLSDKFSDVALTPASRAKFAASCVDFCNKYGFDGVDLDWEYPVSGGLDTNKYRPEDKQNYTLLVQEIRRQFNIADAKDGDHRLLTIAAPAGYDKMVNYELASMSQSLDWMNLMTYDYHGSWENVTNHQSALYGNSKDPSALRDKYTISYTVDAYLRAGVPAEKLTLGAPIYGRSWRGVGATNDGLFQSAAGAGSGTWETGSVDYFDLLNKVKTQPSVYQLHWDDQAQVPYVYAPTVEGGWFSTFENTLSIQKKIDYLMSKGLGGMMFWESSGDVRDANSPDSLIGTAAKGLLGK